MFKKAVHFLVVTGFVVTLCGAFTPPAEAEGRLKEWFKNRKQQQATGQDGGQEMGAGFLDDMNDKGACAERAQSVNRILGSKFGAKLAYGPPADLKDVAYGSEPQQILDVFYSKKEGSKQLAPVVFMVHGGGWCVGDKKLKQVTQNKIKRWLPKGFVFVSVNYPMMPDGSLALEQANDIAQAVAYVQQHAHEWGGDGERVILMGHSAGAHLVSLVNADGEMRARHGVTPLLGTVSLDSGATNLVTQMPVTVDMLKERYKEAFGTDPSAWPLASPYHRLDKTAAPWLGVCATSRTDDPCGQAEEYVAKSLSLGIPAAVLPQTTGESMRKEHSILNDSLGEPNAYTAAVEKFMGSLDPVVKSLLSQ